MSLLAQLSQLAGPLQERDQETTKVLNCVEGKLAAMNLDLEVWLTDDPLITESVMVDGKRYRLSRVMGFGRVGEQSLLLAREIMTCPQDGEDAAPMVLRVCAPQPLRLLSRELRVRAIGKLDALVAVMLGHARDLIEIFDKGRKEQKSC